MLKLFPCVSGENVVEVQCPAGPPGPIGPSGMDGPNGADGMVFF